MSDGSNKLYPTFVTSFTQSEYAAALSGWGGCMPNGFLYKITDSATPLRVFMGSGDALTADSFIDFSQ